MTKVTEVLQVISDKGLSHEDLSVLNKIIVDRLRGAEREKVYNFRVGQVVEFEARGRVFRGKITKLNRQTVNVNCPDHFPSKWRVSPSVIRAI